MEEMLLDRSHRLPDGRHVRLRLARPRDREALHDLLGRLGVRADELEVRRALRCVPGRSLTVCATSWDGARERMVGVGMLALPSREVTLLTGDAAVAALLDAGLRGHAGAWARRVA
jgi:hypothetical protein